MKKISILLPILLALTMLQGCSGGGTTTSAVGSSTVRLLNATTNYASLDMTSSGAAVASIASAVTASNVSSYATVTSGNSTFSLASAGTGTPAAQTSFSLSSNIAYTIVAYTSGQQLQAIPIPDNEVAPASGNGKIRVLNLSPDAGSVDFYLTTVGSALSAVSALSKNINMGTTGYSEVAKGSYHLGITGAGNLTDVRLDLPSITLNDQQILTLILTSTSGGVLVDGLLVNQQGAASAQKNGSARIRVAANIAANGSVTATANGVSLGATLRSPVLGSYTLVPAGALTMNVQVNGAPVTVSNLNATAGADLTLLSAGTVAAPQFFLLNDDNRLPNAGLTKVRLVNGVNGLNGDTISLNADYSQLAYNLAFGAVSNPISVNAGIVTRLEVNSLQGNTSLYLTNNVSFLSPGVYSVFMLGDTTTPVGFVRRDH